MSEAHRITSPTCPVGHRRVLDHDAVPTVIREELGEFAEEWDALVLAAPLPSPFLRSWWLRSAGVSRRAAPCYVLVLDDAGVLVGGLALEVTPIVGVERLRFLGDGPLCPDHLDLLARNGHEADVIASIAVWLARPGARVIDLGGAVDGALVEAALPLPVQEHEVAAVPFAVMGSDVDAFMVSRPSKLRNNVRRCEKRLEADGVSYRVLCGGAAPQLDAALDTFRRLHESQWGSASGLAPAMDRSIAAARAGLAAGELQVHELVAGAEVGVSQLWFAIGKRASFYQGGRVHEDRRWRGAGTVIMARIIEHAIRNGMTEVDFLRGDERYKSDWSTGERRVRRLRAAYGARGRAALALWLQAERMWAITKRAVVRLPLGRRRSAPPHGAPPV
jgi:CelD/BcsL family acetyltransferase involved in cellulose biosynthesis